MESQSIFVKYQIWHERMSKFSELSCMSFDNEKMNRIKAIHWSLINTISSIENGQRTALKMVDKKMIELLCLKDDNGNYINNGIEHTKKQLRLFINEYAPNSDYADFKDLLMLAYDETIKKHVKPPSAS